MKPAGEREEFILREALKRSNGLERKTFLDGACVGDDALRARLEALLHADARDAQAYCVLAMAFYRLKQLGEARAALSNALQIAPTKLPSLDSPDLGDGWPDVVMADILCREQPVQPGFNGERTGGCSRPVSFALGGMSLPCHIITLFLAVLCTSCGSQRDTLLSLPYRQFDQTPGTGWRAMAERQQFAEAAALVETYLPLHPELVPKERALLHFHAAQLLAVAGRDSEALVHLEQAAVPDNTPGFPAFPARWNDFVAATRAFLLRQRSGLIAARARMASGPSNLIDIFFLKGVDVLVSRFEDSYRDVYLSQGASRK